MFRNENGFTFTEVMFALAILTVTAASTASVLIITLSERESVREQFVAYEILQNTFEEIWITNIHPVNDKTIEKNGTIYRVRPTTLREQIKICVQWNGSNGREYEECGAMSYD